MNLLIRASNSQQLSHVVLGVFLDLSRLQHASRQVARPVFLERHGQTAHVVVSATADAVADDDRTVEGLQEGLERGFSHLRSRLGII